MESSAGNFSFSFCSRGSQAQSQAGGFKKSTTISAILSPPAAAPELGGIPEHKRSKRPRPSTEEEYAALCLVMLARGHTEGPHHHQHISLPIPKQQQQLEYKCTICGKALGSYHALGGHKNGHRVKVHKELSTFGSLYISLPTPFKNHSTEVCMCRKAHGDREFTVLACKGMDSLELPTNKFRGTAKATLPPRTRVV